MPKGLGVRVPPRTPNIDKSVAVKLRSFYLRFLMFEIKICSIDVSQTLRQEWSTKAIGLVDPNVAIHFPCTPTYLVCPFHDVEELSGYYYAPMPYDINEILEFSHDFVDDDKILFHCHAGVSRSTATALGVLVQHGMKPNDAFKYVLNIRPQMNPNKRILRLFDSALKLKDTLIDAYNQWVEGVK